MGQVVWAEDRREGRCPGEELTRTKALRHVMVGGLYRKLYLGHLLPLLFLSLAVVFVTRSWCPEGIINLID